MVLVGVNLIPLYGVLYQGWSVYEVLVLFWLENVIIGIINECKFVSILFLNRDYNAVFMVPFFAFHYGLFTMGHGAIILSIFGSGHQDDIEGLMLGVLPLLMYGPLMIPAISLFSSHFFSFVFNFIGRGKYKSTNAMALMIQPYGRIIILHVTVLIGGLLVEATGENIIALLLLIILKTTIDLIAHSNEHGNEHRKSINPKTTRP